MGHYGSVSGAHGFLYEAGVFTMLDVPGANNTTPSGINDDGQIVGYYSVGFGSEFRQHGFLYAAGGFTVLDVPGATHTQAFGINSNGQIVGVYNDSSGYHGFLYDAGVFTPLDVSMAFGINDVGGRTRFV